jgi:hypothetical protein
VALEDSLFERQEVVARLDADLGQHVAEPLAGPQRLDSSAPTRKGLDQQMPEVLAIGVLLDRHLQFAEHELVIAQREVGFDAELHGGQTEFVEAVRLEPERLLVGQIAERSASPEPERFPTQARALLGVALGRDRPAEEHLEPHRVDGLRADVEFVGVVDPNDCVGSEEMTEVGDVGLQGVVRRVRGVVTPERLMQEIHRHCVTGSDRQSSEHGTGLGAADRRRAVGGDHVDRSENPNRALFCHDNASSPSVSVLPSCFHAQVQKSLSDGSARMLRPPTLQEDDQITAKVDCIRSMEREGVDMKLFEHHETDTKLEQLPELPHDVEVPDDISGLRRPTTLKPADGRVRWIRWLAAIVVLGAVGGIAAMLLSTSSETEEAPTAVDYLEVYGTDNPVILNEDAVAGSTEIVGTIDNMELYGTDNPVFVEEAPLMEQYGTDNPVFVPAIPYMELYGTDNPVFVEEAPLMEQYGTDNPVFVEEAEVTEPVYTGEYFELYGTDNPVFEGN